MLKKIAAAVLFLLVILLAVVAFQPSDFQITRSTRMSALPATIYGEVNDFHQWAAWSPWEKLDPAMQKTFSGAPAGVGALYAWSGNRDAGKGKMEITESRPGDYVKIKLDFIEPFAATSTTDFSFKPEGKETIVTWTMSGKNNFMAKAICMFMNMDKMVGGDFERGLAQLKTVSESVQKQ